MGYLLRTKSLVSETRPSQTPAGQRDVSPSNPLLSLGMPKTFPNWITTTPSSKKLPEKNPEMVPPLWSIPATSHCLTCYLLPPDPTSAPDGSGCHSSIQLGVASGFLHHLPFLFWGAEIFLKITFQCTSIVSCHRFFPNFGFCLVFFLKLLAKRKSSKWLLYFLVCFFFLLLLT